MSTWSLACRQSVFLSDSRITNISKSFTHKMAAKTSWQIWNEITSLTLCITGVNTLWDPRDASPPTLEITGTRCISSLQTFATGCHFFAGHCGGKYALIPQTSSLNLRGEGKKSRLGNGWSNNGRCYSEM